MATKTSERDYRYGFSMPDPSVYRSPKGLSKKIVERISYLKGEPDWMRRFRLRSYDIFRAKKMPSWGVNLSNLNFDDIHYFVKPTDKKSNNWSTLPRQIKNTFDKLGIPEAEKNIFAGVGAQYDSEVVYHSLKQNLEKKGVIFLDTDAALKQYPEIFQEYFGKAIPPGDNKFAALNSAVWSGGSFVYVPSGISVEIPLQAYFRINSKVQYTTIQNWSDNVYNLVTKRAFVREEGSMRWIDGNIGSKVTMKYPSGVLQEKGAKLEVLSFA